MMKFLTKIADSFDNKFGWFFTNGRKAEEINKKGHFDKYNKEIEDRTAFNDCLSNRKFIKGFASMIIHDDIDRGVFLPTNEPIRIKKLIKSQENLDVFLEPVINHRKEEVGKPPKVIGYRFYLLK